MRLGTQVKRLDDFHGAIIRGTKHSRIKLQEPDMAVAAAGRFSLLTKKLDGFRRITRTLL